MRAKAERPSNNIAANVEQRIPMPMTVLASSVGGAVWRMTNKNKTLRHE